MNNEDVSTREKIIHATISFIEKYGINAVTTRGIAKEANVNSAAINYYFGTKEKLLDETLKLTLQNLQTDFSEINEKDEKPGDMIAKLLYYYLAGSMIFPGVTKAHLYGLFAKNDTEGPFTELFKNFISSTIEKFSSEANGKSKEELEFEVAQLFSAVLIPCIFPNLFKSIPNLDFKNPETQKTYITNLVKHYFPIEKELKDWHPMPLK